MTLEEKHISQLEELVSVLNTRIDTLLALGEAQQQNLSILALGLDDALLEADEMQMLQSKMISMLREEIEVHKQKAQTLADIIVDAGISTNAPVNEKVH